MQTFNQQKILRVEEIQGGQKTALIDNLPSRVYVYFELSYSRPDQPNRQNQNKKTRFSVETTVTVGYFDIFGNEESRFDIARRLQLSNDYNQRDLGSILAICA